MNFAGIVSGVNNSLNFKGTNHVSNVLKNISFLPTEDSDELKRAGENLKALNKDMVENSRINSLIAQTKDGWGMIDDNETVRAMLKKYPAAAKKIASFTIDGEKGYTFSDGAIFDIMWECDYHGLNPNKAVSVLNNPDEVLFIREYSRGDWYENFENGKRYKGLLRAMKHPLKSTVDSNPKLFGQKNDKPAVKGLTTAEYESILAHSKSDLPYELRRNLITAVRKAVMKDACDRNCVGGGRDIPPVTAEEKQVTLDRIKAKEADILKFADSHPDVIKALADVKYINSDDPYFKANDLVHIIDREGEKIDKYPDAVPFAIKNLETNIVYPWGNHCSFDMSEGIAAMNRAAKS